MHKLILSIIYSSIIRLAESLVLTGQLIKKQTLKDKNEPEIVIKVQVSCIQQKSIMVSGMCVSLTRSEIRATFFYRSANHNEATVIKISSPPLTIIIRQ